MKNGAYALPIPSQPRASVSRLTQQVNKYSGTHPALHQETEIRLRPRARRAGQAQGLRRAFRKSLPQRPDRSRRAVFTRPI